MLGIVTLVTLALAAPPSTTLTGPTGTLRWEVTTEEGQIHILGESPDWKVDHLASADLTPIRTVRIEPDGRTMTVDYAPGGAVVQLPGKEIRHEQVDLWDGDTLDIRLGALSAAGRTENVFSIVDPASGKVYKMDSKKLGDEDCGGTPCAHVRIQLTGMLRLFGPTFEYWFGPDGKLLRFTGPSGEFAAFEIPSG